MDIIRRCGLFLLIALVSPVVATGAELASGHPQEYVVQRGDTLWDISARFLQEPWLWPEIWDRNRQIENPHLIYPGDIIALVYVDGKPRLQVRRGGEPAVSSTTAAPGRGVVKYSPRIRIIGREEAIPTIPLSAIRPFLTESSVLTHGQFDAAPYVMSLGPEHIIGGARQKIYARGFKEGTDARRFRIYRRGQVFRDPTRVAARSVGNYDDGNLYRQQTMGEVLGFEALYVGDAVLDRAGDPATLVLTKSMREVLAGDRLFPEDRSGFEANFMPRPYQKSTSGRIIAVVDGVTQIGQYQVVALNLGTEDDVEVGDVFAVYQAGVVVEDKIYRSQELAKSDAPFDWDEGEYPQFYVRPDDRFGGSSSSFRRGELVSLPEERAGIVMVFRPFERVSYALVMRATRDIHIYDVVAKP